MEKGRIDATTPLETSFSRFPFFFFLYFLPTLPTSLSYKVIWLAVCNLLMEACYTVIIIKIYIIVIIKKSGSTLSTGLGFCLNRDKVCCLFYPGQDFSFPFATELKSLDSLS